VTYLYSGLVPLLCAGETDRVPAQAVGELSVAQAEAALNQGTTCEVPGSPSGMNRQMAAREPDLAVAYGPARAVRLQEPTPPAHIVTVCAAPRDYLGRTGRRTQPGKSRVLYGGSAGPGLLSQLRPCIDRLFLGRFAHDPPALSAILDDALACSADPDRAIVSSSHSTCGEMISSHPGSTRAGTPDGVLPVALGTSSRAAPISAQHNETPRT
jgi:triosephosphate isomerase